MNYIKSIFIGLLLIFILLISVLGFLLTTTPGLYMVIKLANLYLPGKIHVQKLQGRLLDEASFTEFSYVDDTVSMVILHGNLSWKFNSLWHESVIINKIHAEKLVIHIKDTPKAIEKTAEIDFTLPKLPFPVKINELSIDQIQLKQMAVTRKLDQLYLQALLNNEQWVINQLNADYANLRFSVQATMQPDMPYTASAQLHFKTLGAPKKGLQGNIKLAGDFGLYHWNGQFRGPLQGTVRGTLKNGFELNMRANWRDVTWPIDAKTTLRSKQGRLNIQGNLLDLNINARAEFNDPVSAEWNLDAQIKNKRVSANSLLHLPQGDVTGTFFYDEQTRPKFRGEIKSKNLNLSGLALPLSQVEFKTQFSGNSPQMLSAKTNLSARYMDNLLRASVNYVEKKFDATLSLGPNTINLRGKLPYQWQARANLPEPHLLHPSLSGLQTTVQGKATVSSPQKGALTLTVRPGVYQSAQDTAIPAVQFKGGHVSVNLTPNALQGTGKLTIDRHKILDLSLRLPNYRLDKPTLPTQPLNGKISLHVDSLDFLQGLSEDIEKLQGQFNLSLTATGTLNKPEINGELALTHASLFIPELNLTLNPIRAKFTSQNKQWKADGSIGSKGKTITLDGQGRFTPEVTGSLKIQGDSFPIMQTAEYTIDISPDLNIGFKPNAVDVSGTVLVPSAKLKPISFSSSVNLNEDAVFASERKDKTMPLNITMDVLLKMGQNVALDVKGLHGFLDGAIHIKQFPQGEPYGVGELTIRDGKYQAYGQDLTIEKGQLLFTGGMLSNPGISLRAVRYFKNATTSFGGSNQLFDFNPENIQTLNFSRKTTVGIDISGRLSTPKITLFSIPSNLSQADILSMLILGKPASQASQSGGQLLLTAISSMNLDSGAKGMHLIDQLKDTLGFDINVQSGSEYNQQSGQVTDSTAFVVGKALSKRLYLSYNIGILGQDSNVLTLKYLLNKFFSIQVTASDEGSGIDFLYTHSKD